MRASTKTISSLAALGLAAPLLAACDASETAETTTLTYWASNQAPSVEDDAEILGETLERYTEETGIEVELEVIPWPELYDRILTAVSSGDTPDVLNIGNTWSVSLQETGAFVPFEGEALETVGGKDKFLQSSYATGGAEGEAPTSVPLYGLSYGFFYNPTMFEEAGIEEPPTTWEEFIEVGKELTRDTDDDGEIDQWGLALEGANVTENAHWAFILGRQHGGRLFDGDTPTFDSDSQVQGVELWVDMLGEHGIANPSYAEYSDGTQAVNEFSEENAAMLLYQGNAMANMQARDFDDYEVAELPMLDPLPGAPVQSHAAGINVSVFEGTGNEEAALELVAHLTGTEEQTYLNDEFQSLPVVHDAYEDPAFQTEEIETFQTILDEHAEPMPLHPDEGQMETLVGNAMSELFAQAATEGDVSEEDVRSALADANTQMSAAN